MPQILTEFLGNMGAGNVDLTMERWTVIVDAYTDHILTIYISYGSISTYIALWYTEEKWWQLTHWEASVKLTISALYRNCEWHMCIFRKQNTKPFSDITWDLFHSWIKIRHLGHYRSKHQTQAPRYHAQKVLDVMECHHHAKTINPTSIYLCEWLTVDIGWHILHVMLHDVFESITSNMYKYKIWIEHILHSVT